MWYIIRISFERVLRNIQKISFKDLGTMLYQGSIHYPVGKLVPHLIASFFKNLIPLINTMHVNYADNVAINYDNNTTSYCLVL